MSSEGSRATDFETLSQKSEVLERETAAVIAGLAKAKRVNRFVFLGVLVVLCAVGCMFYFGMYKRVTSEETLNELGDLAQKQLDNNMAGYQSELNRLVEFARPELTEAFQAQVQKDMPKFEAALNEERQVLVENLQKRLRERLVARQTEILGKFEGILKEEFPLIDDEQKHDRMMANVKTAMEQLVQKYYVDELREQLEAMYEVWDTFPVADPITEGDGQDPLADQAFGYLLELLQVKLSGNSALAATEQL